MLGREICRFGFAGESFAPPLANAATQPTSWASRGRAGVRPASVFGNRPNFSLGALTAGIIATRWSEGNYRREIYLLSHGPLSHAGSRRPRQEEHPWSFCSAQPILDGQYRGESASATKTTDPSAANASQMNAAAMIRSRIEEGRNRGKQTTALTMRRVQQSPTGLGTSPALPEFQRRSTTSSILADSRSPFA